MRCSPVVPQPASSLPVCNKQIGRKETGSTEIPMKLHHIPFAIT